MVVQTTVGALSAELSGSPVQYRYQVSIPSLRWLIVAGSGQLPAGPMPVCRDSGFVWVAGSLILASGDCAPAVVPNAAQSTADITKIRHPYSGTWEEDEADMAGSCRGTVRIA